MIYFVEAIGADRIKIGYTNDNLAQRLTDLQVASGFRLQLLATCAGEHCDEQRFHNLLCRSGAMGEWFFATREVRTVVDAISAGASLESVFDGLEGAWLAGRAATAAYVAKADHLMRKGIATFCERHSRKIAAKVSDSNISSVKNWLAGKSTPTFDRLIELIRYDVDAFSGLLEHWAVGQRRPDNIADKLRALLNDIESGRPL